MPMFKNRNRNRVRDRNRNPFPIPIELRILENIEIQLPRFHMGHDLIQEILLGNPVADFAVQGAHGQGPGFFLLAPDGQNQWGLGQLGVAYLPVQAFRAAVQFGPQAGRLQGFLDRFGIFGQFIVDGQQGSLDRCQPQREAPGEMFDQDAEEAFDRAEMVR